jgi:hypothetical protein
MSGIGVVEKSDVQAFIDSVPTRFTSYQGSRTDVIFGQFGQKGFALEQKRLASI